MILACGEALIDMLPRRSEAGEEACAPYAGGAVFNTAIALGRLGAPAGFFSGLSSDLSGDFLRHVLTESCVDTTPAHLSSRLRTLAFVRLNDGQAGYTFYDENTAGRTLSPADLPVRRRHPKDRPHARRSLQAHHQGQARPPGEQHERGPF